jgi:hypothetical protein
MTGARMRGQNPLVGENWAYGPRGKKANEKNSNHPLVAPAASPAVGITAPVGGGGLVAAAAAARVGVAAVPVVVSEVGELLTLSTVAAFVESPAVLVSCCPLFLHGKNFLLNAIVLMIFVRFDIVNIYLSSLCCFLCTAV